MKASGYLKWLPIVIAGIFAISIQKNHKSNDAIQFDPEYFENHTWILVNEQGKPLTSDHQTCTLVFLDNNEFEMRKTFKYSGSTFRIPGKFIMQDSTLKLKNMRGTQSIGEAYIDDKNHLLIKWNHLHTIYGKGTETFMTEASCVKKPYNQQFTRKMLNYFKPN
jgi:hypothetical protein